jgi:1,4-dihydroxy-2-naphthoate octaprenyltransferase
MTARQFLRIVEIRTKIVSLSSFLIGTAYAGYRPVEVDPVVAVLFLIALLCVDMGTTAFNSFFDYMRGVDTKTVNTERDKVLVHDGVAPGVALLVSLGLFAGAVVVGLIVGVLSSLLVVLVGAAGMAVGFLYNGGPMPISRTPVGELFAGLFLGGIVVTLAYAVHAEAVTGDVLLVSLPSTLFVASILTTNNTCDVDGDRAAGRRTLAVLLGRHAARWIIYGQGMAAYGVLAWLTAGGTLPEITWTVVVAGVPASAAVYRSMHRRGYGHETKGRSMQGIIRAFAIYTVLFAGSLVAGVLLEG